MHTEHGVVRQFTDRRCVASVASVPSPTDHNGHGRSGAGA